MFDESFWDLIPAVEGAADACRILCAAGHEFVCVTALPEEFRRAREQNLRSDGFPIAMAHATDNIANSTGPKTEMLNALHPVAFVDRSLRLHAKSLLTGRIDLANQRSPQ